MPPLARSLAAILLVLLAVPAPSAAQGLPPSRAGDAAPTEHLGAAFGAIVDEVVQADGRVRYDLLRGRLAPAFARVLKAVETQDPAALATREARLAFWLNAYNAQMLANVLAAPEVDHIVDDGASDRFFKTPLRTAGRALSLDAIEHVILRRQPGPPAQVRHQMETLDPRIHVGLNCAAVGCPRLRAFTADAVDRQLDEAMRAFVNDPAHLGRSGDRWALSSILDWFAGDFDGVGRPGGDVLLAYLDRTRPDAEALRALLAGRPLGALREDPSVRYRYDWRVNAAAR